MEYIDLTGENGKNIVAGSFVGTVGFFDGVHLGHRHLIKLVVEESKRLNLPSAVITFPIHPRKVLQREYQPALLCGFDEKVEQLRTTGIDYCISLSFTKELSLLSAKEFMQQMLLDKIGLNTLVIGYDHRFGHKSEGNFPRYEEYGKELGLRVIQAKELQVDNENVSSTKIRRFLKNGDIKKANRLLSYNYTLSGIIVEGYQVGRTIGFPTANIRSWEQYKVVPRMGVYAVLVHLGDVTYRGMLYIGRRPTLYDESDVSIEVNIFDFHADLYNQSIKVEFIDFIRDDVKFTTLEQLAIQINRDKEVILRRLNDTVSK